MQVKACKKYTFAKNPSPEFVHTPIAHVPGMLHDIVEFSTRSNSHSCCNVAQDSWNAGHVSGVAVSPNLILPPKNKTKQKQKTKSKQTN